MQLPKELTTVTPLSKAVALLMFISLPIIAFFFGMRYQIMILKTNQIYVPVPTSVACTEELRMCEDGSTVARTAPNCTFKECPKVRIQFDCPEEEYIDCMPGPGPVKTNCSREYLSWAHANCPNFKGAAL